jgi:hypothetical protein
MFIRNTGTELNGVTSQKTVMMGLIKLNGCPQTHPMTAMTAHVTDLTQSLIVI